jgi:hypothetical protein
MQDLCIYPIRLTASSPSLSLHQFSARLRQNSARAKSLDFKFLFGPDSRTPRTHLWGYRVSAYGSRSHFGHSTAHAHEFDPGMQQTSVKNSIIFLLHHKRDCSARWLLAKPNLSRIEGEDLKFFSCCYLINRYRRNCNTFLVI